MNVKRVIENKNWYKLGRWKEPIFLVEAVTQGATNQKYGNVLPFAPSIYIGLDFRQYVPIDEYQTNIDGVSQLFKQDLDKTFQKLKKEIKSDTAALNVFNPGKLDQKIIIDFFELLARKGRQWYEIMIADGALSKLYPASLPQTFTIYDTSFNPESILTKVALPKKLFPIIEEDWHLLEIATSYKKGDDISQALKLHTQQYSWMNSMNWSEKPFTETHYQKEVDKLVSKDPQTILRDKKRKRDTQYATAEKLLSEIKQRYPEAWQYIDVIRELTDLKEENWDAVSLAGARMRPLFENAAVKYDLSYFHWMQMTPSEMVATFKNNKKSVDVNELNQRLEHFLCISTLKEPEVVIAGDKAKQLESLIEKEVPQIDELRGMSVWQGQVKGKVRVIPSVDFVHTMQEGEILVCPMTDPDFMPAIKKASAIVTDQGGLLCHAAIVARELQIPCIVGTQFATRILRDGDHIEVNATEGIVRRLP